MRNRKYITMALASLVLVAAISVKPAMAYFTASTSASGRVAIDVGPSKTVVDEKIEGLTKTISVINTGDYPVEVRVKAIYGSTVTANSDSEKWELRDGYYYYSDKLNSYEKTDSLVISFSAEDVKKNSEDKYNFNVIILQEARRVYSDGSYDDWEATMDYVGGNTNE